MALRPPINHGHISPIDETHVPEALLKSREELRERARRAAAQEPDHRQFRLLCPRREGPSCRQAEQGPTNIAPRRLFRARVFEDLEHIVA